MLFRIKEKIRNLIIFFFMAKRSNIDRSALTDFDPNEYKKQHIANSSIITMYKNEAKTLFFRECRRHKRLKPYLFECVEEYFDNVCKSNSKDFLKDAVLCDLSKRKNYRKALRITSIFDSHLLEILSGSYRDYSATGFESFAEHKNNEDFIAFLQYFSCALNSHRVNSYLKVGSYENFNANKQLATYKLACLLGLEKMIPAVWTCRFDDEGKTRVGTIMDKAEGAPPSDVLPEERKKYDKASFLCDLTNLEYFDALCYQLDHRLDNYYVTKNEKGVFDHVVAFDNDAARTFFVLPTLPKGTYAGANCVLAKGGVVSRPYMDKKFLDRLLIITPRDVKLSVGDYLSPTQLYCLNQRINRLRKAALKTAQQRKDFLVSDWNTVSSENAADSKWGTTYFSIYLTDTLMLDREKEFAEMRNKS